MSDLAQKKMSTLKIKNFSVNVASEFASPRPFADFNTAGFASGIVGRLPSNNILASDFSLRVGDQLFNYDLTLNLFGGLGKMVMSADALRIEVERGAVQKDVQIVEECILAIIEQSGVGAFKFHDIRVYIHSAFEDSAAAAAFLTEIGQSRIGNPSGYIFNFTHEQIKSESRLLVEPSRVHSDSIFTSISVQMTDAELANFETIFQEVITNLGVSLVFES